MESRKLNFLKGILGEQGASALATAADRSESIESAIMPRSVMSWLSVTSQFGYDGQIPGVDDTYLDFTKNENEDSYYGSITVGNGLFPFDNASIIHLAALISVALGGGSSAAPIIKDSDLINLGKSIDVMVKTQYIAAIKEQLSKAGAEDQLAGKSPPHVATKPTPPGKGKDVGGIQPDRTKKLISTKAKVPTEIKSKPATGKLQPPPRIPGARIPGSKVLGVKVPKAKGSAALTRSECPDCGLPLIKNEKFVGCMCFRSFASEVTLSKRGSDSYVQFAPTLDRDVATQILEALGVK